MTAWTHGESDLVCSWHFNEGKPSIENPNPTINLGYERPAKRSCRALVRKEIMGVMADQTKEDQTATSSSEHSQCLMAADCNADLPDIAHSASDCQSCLAKDA